jgi:hypothetical protein
MAWSKDGSPTALIAEGWKERKERLKKRGERSNVTVTVPLPDILLVRVCTCFTVRDDGARRLHRNEFATVMTVTARLTDDCDLEEGT